MSYAYSFWRWRRAASEMRRSEAGASPTPIRGLIQVSDIFPYRNGELFAEEVPITMIAAAVGTPFSVYSSAGFAAQYQRFADAFLPERPLICYAVKANSNLAVLRHFAGLKRAVMWFPKANCAARLPPGCLPSESYFPGSARRRPK